MTETIYNFTVPTVSAAAEFLAADPDSAHGSLDDALCLAAEFDCDVTLMDDAGFACGWVHADGKYTLN